MITVDKSYRRLHETADNNAVLISKQDPKTLLLENKKLTKQLAKLKAQRDSLKKTNKKLKRDLLHQEEMVKRMNSGRVTQVLSQQEIDEMLDVFNENNDEDGISEAEIREAFENINNRLLRLEHLVLNAPSSENDYKNDEYGRHTVTLKQALSCLSQEEIDELIEYFKNGLDWVPKAFRDKK
jgi:hypothetical protein